MSGFDDLIAGGLPYLATELITATSGTTWLWEYGLIDSDGALVDVSAGFAFTANIRDQNRTLLYTPTVTSPSAGVIRCTVAPATSAADPGGQYLQEVVITRTSDSAKVALVGGGDSKFVVRKAVS